MIELRTRRRFVAVLGTIGVSMVTMAAPAAHPAPPLDSAPQMAGERPVSLDEHVVSVGLERRQSSQDSAPQRTPEEIRALAERLAESARPGPEHERLARMAGVWDVEIKMWPRPGAEPMVMQGTVEAKTILGGRFLVQTAEIADTDPMGEQVSILGFDRRSGTYTLIGLDTAGTYWVTASGPADAGGDVAVLSGEDYDPIFERTQLYDFVLRWPDEDTFITEIVFKDEMHTRGGEPFKMVETVQRRSR